MNEHLNALVGAKISEFRRKMAKVKKTINDLPKRTTLTIKTKFEKAEKNIQKFQNRLIRLSNFIHAFGTVGANVLQGGMLIASPAIVPILASAVGLVGSLGPLLGVAGGGVLGLASAFGLAGAGAMAFGAVATSNLNDVFSASSDLKKLQEELAMTDDVEKRAEIMDEMAKIQGNLNGEQSKALKSLSSMQSVWSDIMKDLEKPTMEIFTKAMSGLSSVLVMLKPTFQGATNAVNNLMDSLNNALQTDNVKAFFDYMGKTAGPMLEAMGKAGMNVMLGFMNLVRGFDPLTQSTSQGLLNMTQRFADWSSTVIESDGFQKFIKYVQTNGPKLLSIIGNIGGGLIGMFTAFAPLAADMLTRLQNLTARFKEWGQSLSDNQQFQKFIGYIRDNAPTVIALIGNIASFLVNLGIAMAPIGAKVLELVNGFFAWTSSMMEAHPWVGKLIAVGVMLAGALMATIPFIIAIRTAFAGLPGVIVSMVSKILPVFNTFKLMFIAGFKNMGIRLTLFVNRMFMTATNVLSAFGRMITGAAKWVAQTAAHIAKVIARFALLSAKAALHAGKVALSFTVTMVKAAVKAAAQFAVQTGKMIAKYALLGAKSLVHAARVAASWVIAMGPVGWVIATIIGVAAVVIANWEKIRDWTVKMWDKVWGKIKDIGSKIKGFFDGLNLYESGKAIIQSAIDGLMAMKDKIVGKVEGIVGAVRDLWPFSPAKEGPLSDIHKMDFAGPIGRSINKARRPIMQSMTDLAGAARKAFTPDVAMADVSATATFDTSFSGNTRAIDQAINAEINDFELPGQEEQYAVINIGGYEARGVIRYITEEQEREQRINKAFA